MSVVEIDGRTYEFVAGPEQPPGVSVGACATDTARHLWSVVPWPRGARLRWLKRQARLRVSRAHGRRVNGRLRRLA